MLNNELETLFFMVILFGRTNQIIFLLKDDYKNLFHKKNKTIIILYPFDIEIFTKFENEKLDFYKLLSFYLFISLLDTLTSLS